MNKIRTAVLVAALLCCLVGGVVWAQVSGSYDLSWNVLGGGGGARESASYQVADSLEQPFIGQSQGASYQVGAGYWYGIAVPTLPLLEGDVNRDWQVNLLDLVSVAIAFNAATGDPRYDPDADLNNDGIVDIFDLVKVGINFGAGETPW